MADLSKLNKIGVKSGLHARMAQSELMKEVVPQTDPSQKPNRIALMLDCSGSMSGEKIQLLREATTSFIQEADFNTTSIALETFGLNQEIHLSLISDRPTLWAQSFQLDAMGGTPLAEAMRACFDYPLTRGIIISDGDANSPDACIDTARSYAEKSVPIDTVHIGDSVGGEATLKEISRITGGLFVKFKDVKAFSTAFKFLLPETRQDAARLLLTAGANEVK
jgi:Mg-chelatase subunit ChlD